MVIYQELLYDDPVKSCADFLSSLLLLPQFLSSSPLPSPNLEDVESTQSAISKLFLTRPRTETYSTKTLSISFTDSPRFSSMSPADSSSLLEIDDT